MLTLYFEGWFQCRLATDPDPTDELIGVTGPTFIVAGEPYLDRIIRLQNPVAPRFPHEHDIGVNVNRVEIDEQEQPDHPLIGAAHVHRQDLGAAVPPAHERQVLAVR